MIRIDQIKININIVNQNEELLSNIKKLLQVSSISEYEIVKKSIDARKKPDLYYVYSVNVNIPDEQRIIKKCKCKSARILQEKVYSWPTGKPSSYRPVIVGMGPAGLFCAYKLALAGARPIICERGYDVDKRTESVEKFWQTGLLDTTSNVQFGEGGAGTFSDGKLNTLVNDKFGRNKEVLKIFVKNGANPEILYDSKPHIGTDILKTVVKNMRNEILAAGGEVHFGRQLTNIEYLDNNIVNAYFNDGDCITTDALVLAIGHSARDTFEMLYKMNIPMEAKPFSVGLRVQHSQKMIDARQYGQDNLDKNLPASPYKLTYNTDDKRGVFSFCMCPGGYVVNASSEENMLAINGMSYSKRDSNVANSAIIITVNPSDFENDSPLGGIAFQRRLESEAYRLGSGCIPYESYSDYKASVTSNSTILNDEGKDLLTAFKGKSKYSAVNKIMPDYLNELFINGMESFDKVIPGFADNNVVVAGIESRTSSPVRIIRDHKCRSIHPAVYPCGEGAGYAGGITSAAMDGMLIAEEIWKR